MTDTVNVPQEMIDAVMKVAVGVDECGSEVFPGPFVADELVRVVLAATPKAGPANSTGPASDELLSIVKELRDAGNGLFVLKNKRGDHGYFDDLADRIIAMDARLSQHKGPQS